MFGQNFWLGSREACGAVQNPVAITLSQNFERIMHKGLISDNAPFAMDYRVVYLSHRSPWQVEIKLMSEQIIHIGLCLPTACSSEEIHQLTNSYVDQGMFVENDIYDIRPEVVYIKDLKLKESFYEKRTFKLLLGCLAFTLTMMMAASFLKDKNQAETEKQQTATISTSMNAPSHILNDDYASKGLFSPIKNFVQCYDVEQNYAKIFVTRENVANEIPVINGLRSVCAIWIMIFHVVWFMYFTVNNKAFLISYAERIFFQYVSSAPLLVDVFFTIR